MRGALCNLPCAGACVAMCELTADPINEVRRTLTNLCNSEVTGGWSVGVFYLYKVDTAGRAYPSTAWHVSVHKDFENSWPCDWHSGHGGSLEEALKDITNVIQEAKNAGK